MTAGSPIVDAYIHASFCRTKRYPCTSCGAELQDRIDAALAMHYPAINDSARTPLCPDCEGAAGHHPCGCWAPEGGVKPVCGHCHTGGRVASSVPWPCPTAVALGAVTPW